MIILFFKPLVSLLVILGYIHKGSSHDILFLLKIRTTSLVPHPPSYFPAQVNNECRYAYLLPIGPHNTRSGFGLVSPWLMNDVIMGKLKMQLISEGALMSCHVMRVGSNWHERERKTEGGRERVSFRTTITQHKPSDCVLNLAKENKLPLFLHALRGLGTNWQELCPLSIL